MTEANDHSHDTPPADDKNANDNEAAQDLGYELLYYLRQETYEDLELFGKARELIADGADLTIRDDHPVHPYSAFAWAASNGYEGTLLTIVDGLVQNDTLTSEAKADLLDDAMNYLPSGLEATHGRLVDVWKAVLRGEDIPPAFPSATPAPSEEPPKPSGP